MNIQSILSNARKLGLSEADVSKITTLSEKMNRAKAQLSEKASAKYEPRNLLGQKAEDRVFRSKGDLKQDKKDTKIRIDDSKDTVKKARKDRREAFWKIVDATKRKDAIKAAKKQEQQALSSITRDEHHIADIDKTLADIDTEARTALSETETELQTISTSIQTQLATKKDLDTLSKMMKKIDLNDKKYAPLIAFYNTNAKLAPSLDNPLPAVPTEVKELMTEIRMETVEKTIRFTSAAITRYAGTTFRAASQFTRDYINAIRQSRNNQPVLTTTERPLLPAGSER